MRHSAAPTASIDPRKRRETRSVAWVSRVSRPQGLSPSLFSHGTAQDTPIPTIKSKWPDSRTDHRIVRVLMNLENASSEWGWECLVRSLLSLSLSLHGPWNAPAYST